MTEETVTLAEAAIEEAIVATLMREPGVPTASKRAGNGWTASVAGGGGPGADPATIEFQKTRILPTCQMHSVAFTNNRGIPVEWVIRTWQNSDRSWVVAPVGGGGHAPLRTKPWVNSAAQFGPDHFAAGGHVEGSVSEQAVKVRLIFTDGFTLEDSVDAGIVLFFEPRSLVFPADVEIIDEHGGLLTKYKEFDRGPFVR
jgi:hypothetical protein